MTNQELNDFRDANTRAVLMPDGSERNVRMTPDLWEDLDFLRVVEGINETEIAGFALEEAKLQGETFDRAYRGCVAHLANRWER